MIAQQQDHGALSFQCDELFEYPTTIRAPVDVIAQGDHHVIVLGFDRCEQSVDAREHPWTSPIAIVRDGIGLSSSGRDVDWATWLDSV